MTLIAIEKVSIGSSRRPLKDQKVAELMQSIKANGLLNPITLDQNFTLIAGLHRLTACQLLGFTEIECKVVTCDSEHARLAEIDENLIRNELEALERAEFWLERDQILERLGLRARSGDNQFTQRGSETNSPPLKTTLELARETGYTDRTFQQGKQIARDITPEVKKELRGTPLAKSPKALLKVARAGSEARKQAEQAEQAMRAAQAKQQQGEAAQQEKIAQAAREKQRELQLVALHTTEAEKAAKLATKKSQRKETTETAPATLVPTSQVGDEWLLDRHLLYCGGTASEEFIDRLPSNAALAIASPKSSWMHDYLVQEAQVVAVICQGECIHHFCRQHQMPFRYEFLAGNLYVAIFSQKSVLKPEQPIHVEGIEGIVAYLVSLYTKPGSFVINSALGNGEVLIACERMERICFTADPDPLIVDRVISRWQKWTGNQAQKADL